MHINAIRSLRTKTSTCDSLSALPEISKRPVQKPVKAVFTFNFHHTVASGFSVWETTLDSVGVNEQDVPDDCHALVRMLQYILPLYHSAVLTCQQDMGALAKGIKQFYVIFDDQRFLAHNANVECLERVAKQLNSVLSSHGNTSETIIQFHTLPFRFYPNPMQISRYLMTFVIKGKSKHVNRENVRSVVESAQVWLARNLKFEFPATISFHDFDYSYIHGDLAHLLVNAVNYAYSVEEMWDQISDNVKDGKWKVKGAYVYSLLNIKHVDFDEDTSGEVYAVTHECSTWTDQTFFVAKLDIKNVKYLQRILNPFNYPWRLDQHADNPFIQTHASEYDGQRSDFGEIPWAGEVEVAMSGVWFNVPVSERPDNIHRLSKLFESSEGENSSGMHSVVRLETCLVSPIPFPVAQIRLEARVPLADLDYANENLQKYSLEYLKTENVSLQYIEEIFKLAEYPAFLNLRVNSITLLNNTLVTRATITVDIVDLLYKDMDVSRLQGANSLAEYFTDYHQRLLHEAPATTTIYDIQYVQTNILCGYQ